MSKTLNYKSLQLKIPMLKILLSSTTVLIKLEDGFKPLYKVHIESPTT